MKNQLFYPAKDLNHQLSGPMLYQLSYWSSTALKFKVFTWKLRSWYQGLALSGQKMLHHQDTQSQLSKNQLASKDKPPCCVLMPDHITHHMSHLASCTITWLITWSTYIPKMATCIDHMTYLHTSHGNIHRSHDILTSHGNIHRSHDLLTYLTWQHS